MPCVRLARWTLCMKRTVSQTLPSSTQRNQIINGTFRQQFIFIRSVLKHLRSYSKDTRNIPSEPHQLRSRGLLSVLSGIQIRIGIMNRMPVKTFHDRWILSSNLTRLPVQWKIAGFLLLIPSTRESQLLQTIGSHVADQLNSPLRPICPVHVSIEETLFNFLYIFNV